MAESINRKRAKFDAKALLTDAQVAPKRFYALYLALILALDVIISLAGSLSRAEEVFSNPVGLFVTILSRLLSVVLGVGCWLYLFGVHRGERTEYLTLFDGFSFVGRIILLYLTKGALLGVWFLPALLAFSAGYAGLLTGGAAAAESAVLLPLSAVMAIPGCIAFYRYRFAVLDLCENPTASAMEAIRMSRLQTVGYKSQLFTLDVSYFGWALLASLPTVVLNAWYYTGGDLSVLSAPAEAAISGAFLLAVGIFFMPVYQSCELTYFETAKRTSHIGYGIGPADGGEAQ